MNQDGDQDTSSQNPAWPQDSSQSPSSDQPGLTQDQPQVPPAPEPVIGDENPQVPPPPPVVGDTPASICRTRSCWTPMATCNPSCARRSRMQINFGV